MKQEDILELLHAEVLPTMGCTEPGAVALAAAHAAKALQAKVQSVEVTVNSNVYKNGVAVGIPGTGETGMEIAAALGALVAQPEKQLSVLSELPPETLAAARQMLADQAVTVRVHPDKTSLWIEVILRSGENWSRAVIEEKHTRLVLLETDKETVFALAQDEREAAIHTDSRSFLRQPQVTVAKLIAAVAALPAAELEFLQEGIDMNVAAAETGIEKRLGMGIGAFYRELQVKGLAGEDIIYEAKTLTAAAADARMSGEPVPVMSSAGSGNHGITAILPVYVTAKALQKSHEELLRAVAISHLLNVYVKIHTGNLSALCGCAVAAATGATAAVTWLMEPNKPKTVEMAIKNVVANLTGMICDGGKVGCALKLSTAAATALESSLMAVRGIVVPDSNGIIAPTVEDTIRNLGRVSAPGMLETDKVITGVMLEKQEKSRQQARGN
ncbi:MAG: serine dehydratase subunit alpha family protein [Negativicutes bacterium]|nr:serine dehydratase subunit alpha family protein [Negativicutes bacterium]